MFDVGTRVRYVGRNDHIQNKTGTVVFISSPFNVGVRFDEYIPRCHNLSGLCDDCHGWWCNADLLMVVRDNGDTHDISDADADMLMELLEEGWAT